MPFPVSLGSTTWPDGPALLAAVADDARAGGGSVVAGQYPSQWLLGLVSAGALEQDLAVGLVAALLRSSSEAAVLAEATRIAVALDEGALGALVVACLEAFDTGVLLTSDPRGEAESVEDLLLRAAVHLADLDQPELRARVLPRLRHAGLPELELAVLAAHGDLEELQLWLPPVLVEPLSPPGAAALAARVIADPSTRDALCAVLLDAPAAPRAAVLGALLQQPGGAHLAPRLVPTPTAEA